MHTSCWRTSGAIRLQLPAEAACIPLWDLLGSYVPQTRVWTFGGEGEEDVTSDAVTCREPLSVKDGVQFVAASAGEGVRMGFAL